MEVLWRPIAVASSPLVSRSHLRVAARAYTCFLLTLVSELPAVFLVLSLNDMGQWVQKLDSWSPQCIGEADCKEQFDHVPSSTVISHVREAAAWLTPLPVEGYHAGLEYPQGQSPFRSCRTCQEIHFSFYHHGTAYCTCGLCVAP